MLKNIFLFIISVTIGAIITITVYLRVFQSKTEFIKPFSSKTLFSLQNAPTQSVVGNIASVSGSVVWQSRTSPTPVPINSSQKLQQGEEIETRGNGKAILEFANVGIITVSPNTQINIIQTLPLNFVVQQKKGTAEYAKTGDIPMSIRGLDLLININSGKSTISVDQENSQIVLSVETGSAIVAFNDTENLTNILTVPSGSEYIFNNDTKLLTTIDNK
jgi:hypothetical protein